MNIRKPSMQVRIAAEIEVMFFVLALHLSLLLLILFRALQVPLLWLLLPLMIFSLIRSWQQFVAHCLPASVLVVYLDTSDKVSVLLGCGENRPARVHAFHLYGGGVLLCLAIDGVALARTVVIGRRTASGDQIRRWKIRLRQLSDGTSRDDMA